MSHHASAYEAARNEIDRDAVLARRRVRKRKRSPAAKFEETSRWHFRRPKSSPRGRAAARHAELPPRHGKDFASPSFAEATRRARPKSPVPTSSRLGGPREADRGSASPISRRDLYALTRWATSQLGGCSDPRLMPNEDGERHVRGRKCRPRGRMTGRLYSLHLTVARTSLSIGKKELRRARPLR